MTELRLPAALAGHNLTVVDVEGNGQQPPEIIELALLPLAGDRASTEADLHTWLVRPQRPINSIVTTKVHGIGNADVAHSPSWDQVAPEIAERLDGQVVVAHNATVERRVLGQHLPGWAPPLVLDTMRLAKTVWPALPGGYGLDNLISHAGLAPTTGSTGLPDRVGRRHRAGHDTWMTATLLVTLLAAPGWPGEPTWARVVAAAALPDPTSPPPHPGPREDGLW